MQMMQMQAQLAMNEDQRKGVQLQLDQFAAMLDEAKFRLSAADTAADNMRKDEELAVETWAKEQEVEIEKSQQRAASI
jgi:hypothetical protein